MDKTENLNFQEACAAIGRGECVEDANKHIYSSQGYWNPGDMDWTSNYLAFSPSEGPFRIIPDPRKQVEPPPSLTYEQALECEKVRIEWPSNKYWPNKCVEVLYRDHDFKDGPSDSEARWVSHLLKLDLAERRNYRMENVD